MQVQYDGKTYQATKLHDGSFLLNIDEKGNTLEVWEEELESVEIECKICDEDKFVEAGTWALHHGMCERCYCKYQGG